jgi:hypothetical protein
VTYRGKPILYVRVSRGGQRAAQARELRLRQALEVAGIPLDGAHVYCDVDTPPHHLGRALALLLDEATFGRVGTVVVQSLGSFGCYELIVHALLTLERGGSSVLVVDDIANDEQVAGDLRREVDCAALAPRLVVGGGAGSGQSAAHVACGSAVRARYGAPE